MIPTPKNLEEARTTKTGQMAIVYSSEHDGRTSQRFEHRNVEVDIRDRVIVIQCYGDDLKTVLWPLTSVRHLEIVLDDENPVI